MASMRTVLVVDDEAKIVQLARDPQRVLELGDAVAAVCAPGIRNANGAQRVRLDGPCLGPDRPGDLNRLLADADRLAEVAKKHQCLGERGQHGGAEQARALRRDRGRATVLRDAGRIDAAIRDWRAALAANPGNPEAKVALKRAEVHSDAQRRSSMRVKRGGSRPSSSGLTGWLVLAAIIIATIVLLTVYWKLRR